MVVAATPEHNAKMSALLTAIQEGGANANVAHYTMANEVHRLRDAAYSPLPMQVKKVCFAFEPENVEPVRVGLRMLAHKLTPEQVRAAVERGDEDVIWAADFQRYVREVSAIEAENATRCATLMYAAYTYERLGAAADRVKLIELRDSMRGWYDAQRNFPTRDERLRYAQRKTRRYDLIPIAWRKLWTAP